MVTPSTANFTSVRVVGQDIGTGEVEVPESYSWKQEEGPHHLVYRGKGESQDQVATYTTSSRNTDHSRNGFGFC